MTKFFTYTTLLWLSLISTLSNPLSLWPTTLLFDNRRVYIRIRLKVLYRNRLYEPRISFSIYPKLVVLSELFERVY